MSDPATGPTEGMDWPEPMSPEDALLVARMHKAEFSDHEVVMAQCAGCGEPMGYMCVECDARLADLFPCKEMLREMLFYTLRGGR